MMTWGEPAKSTHAEPEGELESQRCEAIALATAPLSPLLPSCLKGFVLIQSDRFAGWPVGGRAQQIMTAGVYDKLHYRIKYK